MGNISRDDWAYAALMALGEGGDRAIAVQPLARRLGVTKGSFYWHFSGRAELVDAALTLWEERGTTEVIASLEGVRDPMDRIRQLLAAAIDTLPHLRTEAALGAAASRGDAIIGPVYARVCTRRMAYLTEQFRLCGVPDPECSGHAAFAAYLGTVQLAAMQPCPLDDERLLGLVAHLKERLVP